MAMNTRTSGVIGGAGQGAAIGSAFGGWGMAAGAIAGGVFGGLMGGGEEDAEKLAEMQAREIERAAKENRRRAMLEMGSTLGLSKATSYASGLQFSGSTKKQYSAIESEYKRRMSWDRHKAKTEAEMAMMGGQMAVSQMQSMGMQSALGGLAAAGSAGAFGTYSQEGGYKSPWET